MSVLAPGESPIIQRDLAADPAADDSASLATGQSQNRPGRWPVGEMRQADLEAEFGTRRGGIPELLQDWRHATIEAAIKKAALQEIGPQIKAARQAALEAAEAELGRKPVKEELKEIFAPAIQKVKDELMPAALVRARKEIAMGRQAEDLAITRALAEMDQKFAALRAKGKLTDPLYPVANADFRDRPGEIVLWENRNFIVLADRGGVAKALVVPKRKMRTPREATPADLVELGKIAAAVSDAFGSVGAKQPPEVWINPPQRLSVEQLHVHVMPKLVSFKDVVTGPGGPLEGIDKPDKEDLTAAMDAEKKKFYPAVVSALVVRLGKSVITPKRP